MTIRSKLLAASLGLVMASGTLGAAFAESSPAATPAPAAQTDTTAVAGMAPKAVASSKLSTKTHRLHVAHRSLTHKKLAHRLMTHGKIAKRSLAKTHLVRSHAGKLHIAKAPIIKTQTVKSRVAKRLVGTQRHAMATTSSVIR